MKKVLVFCVLMLSLVAFTGVSIAQDAVITKKIENIVFKKDKNGNPYARIIVKDQSELNGISYEKGVSAMAFSDTIASVKGLKKGDTLKAVVSVGEYRGNKSFTILKVLN